MLAVREQADALLAEMLAESPTGVLCQEAVARGKLRGISIQSMRRARVRAGLVYKHNGNRPGFWVPHRVENSNATNEDA